MKYLIAKFIFFITGWTLDASKEKIAAARNTVMIAAPHTSNYDLLFALGAFWLMRLPIRFFIKDVYTRWYFLGVFKWLGGIGVDRSNRNNLVDYATEIMSKHTEITLLVPAEGTRRSVERWKTGFYHIAVKAQKDISLGYLDYGKKRAGILEVIPVGDQRETFDIIQDYYRDVEARHPEHYNKIIH